MYYKTMRRTKAPQSPISDSHHGLSINRERLSLRGRHIGARRDCGGFNGTAREPIRVRCDSLHTCGGGRHAERTIEWRLKQARGDFALFLGRDHRSSTCGAWRRTCHQWRSRNSSACSSAALISKSGCGTTADHPRFPRPPRGPSTQGAGLFGTSPPDFLSSRPRLSAQLATLGASICPFSVETRPQHT